MRELKVSVDMAVDGAVNITLNVKPKENYAEVKIHSVTYSDGGAVEIRNYSDNEIVWKDVYLTGGESGMKAFRIEKITFPPKSSRIYTSRELGFDLSASGMISISDNNGTILQTMNLPSALNLGEDAIVRHTDGKYIVEKRS
ncbi:hypothetical protein FACS1894105_12900 [Clostridia bacterium]|nr:hypothetical protein FACS1894105_12900 [Clostridia bacterium]